MSILCLGGRWRAFLPGLKTKGLVGVDREPLEGGNVSGRRSSSAWNHIVGLHHGRRSAQLLLLSFLCNHIQSASYDLKQVHEENDCGRTEDYNPVSDLIQPFLFYTGLQINNH